MTKKRLLAVYVFLLTAFSVILGRLYLIAGDAAYAQTAEKQTVTTVDLGNRRGNLYDTNGVPLTGYQKQFYALSIPGESSYAQLFSHTDAKGQALLYQKRNATAPFLVPVDQDLTSQGIYTYELPERYLPQPIAPHLLGYLDQTGHGIAGLEAAYDELLYAGGGETSVHCVITAQGQLLRGQEPMLERTLGTGNGLRLTLDQRIQRICEGTAQQSMTSGCILVLETDTGKVRACVSMPEFDPNDLQKSIKANDTSLLNRAFCPFNVGSVFKPVLAAAALERGIGWYSTECEGYIDLNDHIYRCAKGAAHGKLDLQGALEESCNCYFIELGQKLGGKSIQQMAQNMGFGQPQFIGGGLKSQAGNLPNEEQLEDLGQLASVSFGQGQLMATPLQVAGMMNALALGGIYTAPSFLEAVIQEDTGKVVQDLYDPQVHRVIRSKTAGKLRRMLVGVVEDGIGHDAKPTQGGAGGKTGTAQTGRFTEDEKELMNFWFAGFYPAMQPQYTIVVLQDEQTEPQASSASIFAQVCNAISYLQDS